MASGFLTSDYTLGHTHSSKITGLTCWIRRVQPVRNNGNKTLIAGRDPFGETPECLVTSQPND